MTVVAAETMTCDGALVAASMLRGHNIRAARVEQDRLIHFEKPCPDGSSRGL